MADTPVPIYHRKSSRDVAAMPVPPWRVKGVLPMRGLAAIYGPSSSGKSFFALDLASAIALGNSWFGFSVRKCPVVYVALEGESGFPKRIRAWVQHNEHPSPDDLSFVIGGDPFEITNPVHVAQLATILPKGCVIVIDTLNRASPSVEENSSEGMGAILAGCKQLQNLTQGLVVLIHHTGKDETRGLRGHSSLLAAMDACIEVRLDDDTRTWCVTKSKDDGAGIEFCFQLSVETLEVDEDDDTITSCAVKPITEVAADTSKLKPNEKMVLGALNAVLATTPLLAWQDALTAACGALAHVDSKHRSTRAKASLSALLNKGKLIRDSDTNLITLPPL